MMVLLRALLMIALAVVTAAPPHVHAAATDLHHAVAADHGHEHGPERHDSGGDGYSGSKQCCASLSVQCGGPALAQIGHWAPAELRSAELRQVHERHARFRTALPEFEPPPPRG